MIDVGGSQQMSTYFEKFGLIFMVQRGLTITLCAQAEILAGDLSLKGDPQSQVGSQPVAKCDVHKCRSGSWRCAQRCSWDRRLCTPPANRAMSGVHNGTHRIGCCAHCQLIMQWPVCTNLLQRQAIVHTSQTCYERCACAQGISGCVHRQTSVRRTVCTMALRG